MPARPLLRLGTRGSPLALAQARETRDRLAAAVPELAAPDAVEIVVVRTTGDREQSRRLAEIGGKALFTKELETALLDGAVDIAVHSMKDVETRLPAGLAIAAMLPREDPRDAFLSSVAARPGELSQGARVGTAALRRQAQLLARRPDLEVVLFRGNVDTRLAKLAAGEVAATLLAICGLKRLGRADAACLVLEPAEMLPSAGQGAIGIECRTADRRVRDWLSRIDHRPTTLEVTAERAMLAALGGSCNTPVAGLAQYGEDGTLSLDALVARPDGTGLHRRRAVGSAADAEPLGEAIGVELRGLADPEIFR